MTQSDSRGAVQDLTQPVDKIAPRRPRRPGCGSWVVSLTDKPSHNEHVCV